MPINLIIENSIYKCFIKPKKWLSNFYFYSSENFIMTLINSIIIYLTQYNHPYYAMKLILFYSIFQTMQQPSDAFDVGHGGALRVSSTTRQDGSDRARVYY
jgi:hypothetical protein